MKRILSSLAVVVMVGAMASMALAECNGCGKGKGKGPNGPKGPKGPGDGTCQKAAFGHGSAFEAAGGKNQNQEGKEDGKPGNGDQVKDRVRPDEPAGPDCPGDCPGCPDCDGDGPYGDGDGVCDNPS